MDIDIDIGKAVSLNSGSLKRDLGLLQRSLGLI